MSSHVVEVAIAILYQGDRFLLQLRDDIASIRYPGHWAFFGGHVEHGEHPDQAIVRELNEEIKYAPPQLTLFRSSIGATVIRHVYHAPLEVSLTQLELREGWDMDLVKCEQIESGEHYSKVAGKRCPIGPPHRQILLDFIQQHPNLLSP